MIDKIVNCYLRSTLIITAAIYYNFIAGYDFNKYCFTRSYSFFSFDISCQLFIGLLKMYSVDKINILTGVTYKQYRNGNRLDMIKTILLTG